MTGAEITGAAVIVGVCIPVGEYDCCPATVTCIPLLETVVAEGTEFGRTEGLMV